MEQYKFKYEKYPSNYTSAGSVSKSNNNEKIESGDGADKSLPLLFTPITIKNLTLKNRIVVSPMCMYSSTDGFLSDFHLVHLGALAKGGAGLIIIEATAVVSEGRISYGDSGLWKDEQIEPIKRIVDFSHEYKVPMGIQLAHAGRKASNLPLWLDGSKASHVTIPPNNDETGWEIYGPSSIPWNEEMGTPIEMSIQDIKYVIESFKQSAIRCIKAGIDFIEIHGAHGYLISSFLSSTSNKRTDQYGSQTFENRSRFLIEIVAAVRSVWTSDKPLSVRISCTEWIDDESSGWTMNETIQLAKLLESVDVDILDCSSSGNNSQQKFKPSSMYQVPFSHQVKQNTNTLLTGTVGSINNGKDAESILEQGKADLVLFGKPFLRNPFFGLQLAHELGVNVDYAIQYQPAKLNTNSSRR